MLRFVDIYDKDMIMDRLKDFNPQCSEFSFANIFCWGFKFELINDHIVFATHEKTFCPVGNAPETVIQKIGSVERIEQRIVDLIEASNSLECLELFEDIDNYDYVYDVQAIRELKGKKYDGKRNHINNALKYNPEIVIISDDVIAECIALEEDWCDFKKCDLDASMRMEYKAIHRLFDNYDKLDCIGIAVKINGKVEGFAVAERLNDDTYAEHFEKANSKFKGIYALLVYELAKIVPSKYLNREQDLGIEGLRKSKESWHPVKMIKKYKIL